MVFNGVHARSFEHVKVTSWKNSFYTDFDRKEITSRGIVRAAVEVPTIRKIEIDFLVKGRNIREIEKKLTDMAQWLQNAGTAKLLSDRDPNNYFKARCTAISRPQYSGLSARFTVTFTCADYKLYNARTDQQNGQQNVDLSNFRFAGKHCLNDMGAVFVEDSRDITPEVKAHKYEITGMSGTLRYIGREQVLSERQLTGSLYLVNKAQMGGLLSEQEIAQRYHEIASWLVNAKRAPLIFDSDAGREYQAEVTEAVTANRTGWENGVLKVKFILQPVGKDLKTSYVESNLDLAANAWGTIQLAAALGPGFGYTTPLDFQIKNNGATNITDLSIEYNDAKGFARYMRLYGNGFSLLANTHHYVVIYGETRYLIILTSSGYYEGMQYIASGDFPTVSPGSSVSVRLRANVTTKLEVLTSFYTRSI